MFATAHRGSEEQNQCSYLSAMRTATPKGGRSLCTTRPRRDRHRRPRKLGPFPCLALHLRKAWRGGEGGHEAALDGLGEVLQRTCSRGVGAGCWGEGGGGREKVAGEEARGESAPGEWFMKTALERELPPMSFIMSKYCVTSNKSIT